MRCLSATVVSADPGGTNHAVSRAILAVVMVAGMVQYAMSHVAMVMVAMRALAIDVAQDSFTHSPVGVVAVENMKYV